MPGITDGVSRNCCTRGGGGYGRPSPRREHACQCNCPSHSPYLLRLPLLPPQTQRGGTFLHLEAFLCLQLDAENSLKAAEQPGGPPSSRKNRWYAARFCWPPRRPWPGPFPRPPPVGLPAWVCLPALLFHPFAAARLAACRRCRWPRPTTSSSPSLVRALAPPAPARRAAVASVCM